MSRFLMTLTVLSLILGQRPLRAETIQAAHAVELEDATGDARDDDEDIGKDVVKLTLASDGSTLAVTAVLAENVAHYLAGRMAGDVLQISIDKDLDPATGGKTFWGNSEGFEILVSIRTCISYENGGEACAGGLGGLAEEGYFSSYQVATYEQGSTNTKNMHDVFWKSPRQPIEGNVVSVEIPYSDLDVSPGQTLRIAVREADSSFDAASFFPEIELTLAE